MTIERKTFRVELKAAREDGSFEAAIATLNVVDHDKDVIAPGAFGDAVMSVVPAHDHGSVPLGKAKMEDRGNLAVAVGRFNMDIPTAKDWRNALKFDLENPPAVQEWSFAFRPVEAEEETRDGETVRVLKKMDVIEISPVLRGAGVGTGTLAVKGTFEQQIEKTLQAIDDTIERAKGIAKLRADKDKPKSLSDERKSQLAKVAEKFKELEQVIAECDAKAKGESDDSDDGDDPVAKAVSAWEGAEARVRGQLAESYEYLKDN